jgi:DNA-binding transcriptional ArsR family regulator
MSQPGQPSLEPVFVALSDTTRRAVKELLATGQRATATQLSARFPVTRQAIAKHLQVLADAGLVTSERAGRETQWSLTPAALGPAMAWMQEVGGGFDDRIAGLQRHLERQRAARGVGNPLRVAASKQPRFRS